MRGRQVLVRTASAAEEHLGQKLVLAREYAYAVAGVILRARRSFRHTEMIRRYGSFLSLLGAAFSPEPLYLLGLASRQMAMTPAAPAGRHMSPLDGRRRR